MYSSEKQSTIVGIDLGTTNSCVAGKKIIPSLSDPSGEKKMRKIFASFVLSHTHPHITSSHLPLQSSRLEHPV
jgi:molecular chaperone DnaK (HSP70)